MSVILILILASLAVALTFLVAFIWAVRGGQYEDTCTPAMRVLTEEAAPGRRGETTVAKNDFRKAGDISAPPQPGGN